MSSVHSEKLGKRLVRIQKPPIKHPQHTLKTIKPAEGAGEVRVDPG